MKKLSIPMLLLMFAGLVSSPLLAQQEKAQQEQQASPASPAIAVTKKGAENAVQVIPPAGPPMIMAVKPGTVVQTPRTEGNQRPAISVQRVESPKE